MNTSFPARAGRSFLLAAALTACLVTPSTNAQSRHASFSFGPFELTGIPIADCGDFLVLTDYVEAGSVHEVYDKNGNLRRLTAQIEFYESVYYNSEDPSKIIDGGPGERQNESFHAANGLLLITGPVIRITLPGHGQIFHQGGRLVFDVNAGEIVAASGPQSFEEGDSELLCAALS
ncbi:MAG: hypothetical protein R3233_06285 [Xanthomonadales bacterium]|nr:hypothetical protein [Xanthomonadales bacterium]